MQNTSRWIERGIKPSVHALPMLSHLSHTPGDGTIPGRSELPTLKRRCERDQQLVRGGNQAGQLLTVLSGWAFRYSLLPDGRRQILSVSLTGDTIGLDTLLTGAPAFPVQCATSVVYTAISQERFNRLMRESASFRDRALEILGAQRAAAELSLTLMGQCSAEERVAAIVLEFYDRLAARGLARNNSFALALTQQALADLIGMTVVHLNRVLNRMKARKLIVVDGRQITLLDMVSLRRLAVVPDYAATPSEFSDLL